MDRTQIKERLSLLFTVLQFSSQIYGRLTAFERILINQERGSLLHAMDFPETQIRTVPGTIEAKITLIEHLASQSTWEPITDEYLSKEYLNQIKNIVVNDAKII